MNSFFQSDFWFNEEVLNAVHLHLGAWFDYFMVAITTFGDEIFYTTMLPILYWLYDRNKALKIGIIFLLASALNDWAKHFFGRPRPDVALLSPEIQALYEKNVPHSPGFPSGHTQGSVAFWGGMAIYISNPFVRAASLLLILLVPYSRMYLGVHYPGCILGGYLLGIPILLLAPLLNYSEENYEKLNDYYLLAAIVLFPVLAFALLPGGHLPNIMGVFSGFLAGAVMARGRVRFNPQNGWLSGIIKVMVGLAGILAIKAGLKVLFPETEEADFLRYWFMGFWGTFAAPLIFSRFALLRGEA